MEYQDQHRIITRHLISANRTTDVRYKYDSATGALLGIDSKNGPAKSFGYDANGNLANAFSENGVHQYGFSSSGDLTAYSAKGLDLTFASDPDGLIASLKDAKDANAFDYKAGGELANIAFADGSKAKYEYQPSGLRAKLTYDNGRQTRYAYDYAGNLISTEILDTKGKQVQGQNLTLNESYQVIKRILFDKTEEKFEYDVNGQLTKHTKNDAVTRFEYDELNRLVAVLTPAGERLKYAYASGERSIVEQYEHSSVLVTDLIDSGFTFGNPFQVLATRPITAPFGTIRFSESLGTFQLANAAGNEIITPETTIEQALQKLGFIEHNTPLKNRQNLFNRPFNTIFMPAEYASINCCFSCSDGAQCRSGLAGGGDTTSCCPPCDPIPPGGTPTPPPGQPDRLRVLSDISGTLACPSGTDQNTQIRRIKYQIVDVDNNGLVGDFSIREQFNSKSADSCGTNIATSESCTPANSTFEDILTVGCNAVGGSCGHTYTHQQWQWCSPSIPIPIGTPGDLVVHNDTVSVGGNFIFIAGTFIFP